MHQHRYLGTYRRVLGLRKRDVRLVSGNFSVAHRKRTVSAGRGGRSRRDTEPRMRAPAWGPRAGARELAGSGDQLDCAGPEPGGLRLETPTR